MTKVAIIVCRIDFFRIEHPASRIEDQFFTDFTSIEKRVSRKEIEDEEF
jgi:hypothetical protein